ncbi:hypothetical protein ACIPM0_15875 [Pseudomonas sichuanensis]|uniref:hypothetical protein n=1 Tax=Pseudomonas sichuanensis TaxID=2213015 RepID=UPI003825768B
MHQVAVLNNTTIYIEDLVKRLDDHHIVVINSTMREQAQGLRDKAVRAMQDWKDRGPIIIYSEFEVVVSPHLRWFAPTIWHAGNNELNLSQTGRLVERAVQIWVARGSANQFLYTNRAQVA